MKFILGVIGIIFLSLSGCGDNVLTNTGPGNQSNTINSFNITGSNGVTQESIPLDSMIDGGKFSIAWSVSSSNPYDYYVSISNSANYALGGDFFNGQGICVGEDCIRNEEFSCVLTISQNSAPSIACGSGTAVTIPLSISPSYMVFRLCHRITEDCAEKALMINVS